MAVNDFQSFLCIDGKYALHKYFRAVYINSKYACHVAIAFKHSPIANKIICVEKGCKSEMSEKMDEKTKKEVCRLIESFYDGKDKNNFNALYEGVNKIIENGCIVCGDRIEARLFCKSYLATYYKDRAWLIYKL